MKYVIVESEHLLKVNFSQVCQTNSTSVRFSIDKKYFLLKYEGDQPDCLYSITQDAIGLEEYTHDEILKILETPNWNGST